MGDAAQALEEASLVDSRKRAYEMFAEHFEQIDAIRDLFDAIGWEHVELDPVEIEGVEIDLDEHLEALEAGLDEATIMLRETAKEGSREDRGQAGIDLTEMERLSHLWPRSDRGGVDDVRCEPPGTSRARSQRGDEGTGAVLSCVPTGAS